MTIREKLIAAGVVELREAGYPDCDEDNILSYMVYKRLFIPFLKDSKGASKVVNAEIEVLIAECKQPSRAPIKHFRTSFPNHVNFSGWWLLSKKGCVAQLIKKGRNLHEHILYVLCFKNGQIGYQQFTIENLMENGALYICPTREDLPIKDEDKVH